MSKLNEPILPGSARTDYERYLRTDELLSLQKSSDAMTHRDELLFQTIHQTAELWLKLACFEVEEAASLLARDDIWSAVRLLRRATGSLDLVLSGTMMLEHLAPWDYHGFRGGLGHGSGFDSPGFKRAHEVSPALGDAFRATLERRGISLMELYRSGTAHEDLFQTGERLIDWDQRLIQWRTMHLRLVERIIGGNVIGTQGTPVEVLGKRLDVRYYPDLWDVRNALTAEAHTSPER
ncbi:MAG TPA: tryptophan 2,3-dioxygenase family protein [Vicinamibacterales bacterium]|nr:tryptophan 2,3-dioxygenase family protein [Vicinamibacterales bacterium]